MDNKRYALLLARKIPHTSVEDLLANAAKIEQHLGQSEEQPVPPPPAETITVSPLPMPESLKKSGAEMREISDRIATATAAATVAFREIEDDAARAKEERNKTEELPSLCVKRTKRTARTCVINATLSKDGDAICLIDKNKNKYYRLLNIKGKLMIDEPHDGIVLEFELRNRPYKIEYDGAANKLTYWCNDDGSAIRTITVDADLDVEPYFLGQPTDKWQTKSDNIIIEEEIDYQALRETVEQRSREEMGKWIETVNALPKGAWVNSNRPTKVATSNGWTEIKWSGVADDIREIISEDSAVISTARQIGTTTFLTSFAAEQSFKKNVCFVTNSKSAKSHVEVLLKSFQHDPEAITMHTFESFVAKSPNLNASVPEDKKFDLVIVDNAAFIPYAMEEAILDRLNLCPHVVMASTPAQRRGLFCEWRLGAGSPNVQLWKSLLPPAMVVGLDVPWTTPFRHEPMSSLQRKKALALRPTDKFENENLCVFRPVSY